MKLHWLALVAIGCGSAPPPAPQPPAPAPAAAPAPTAAVVVEKREPIDLVAVADAIDAAKRTGNWDPALPLLTRAVTEIAEDEPRSVDTANRAADALAEAHAGVDALASLANRHTTKKIITAQVAALRALGKMTDRDKAAGVLVGVVSRVPPMHPRRARTKEEQRPLEEAYGLHLATTGAAINALAELRVASSVKPLIVAMYRMPELFTQERRALVAAGKPAEDALRVVLAGRDTEVEQLISRDKLDRYCGDHDDQPCQPVSAKDFYPAVVLGDFYDRAVVPDLLTALTRKPAPAYYYDDTPAMNTQHNAIFDSLRKIGAPEAVPQLRALWSDANGDLATRTLAAAAYAFVARDTGGVAELYTIAADNTADDNLRQEAANSCARLATDAARMKGMQTLAQRYLDASAKKRVEADSGPKQAAEAADKEFEAAKQSTTDPDKLKQAKRAHKDKTAPFRTLDNTAKAYTGFARLFQTHIARIAPAVRCKRDLACYAKTLTRTADAAFADVKPYLADAAKFTADDKAALRAAEIERATIELGKRPDEAARFLPQLLDALGDEDRLVRQGVVLALGKIAKAPCDACRARIDEVLHADEGKTTLADLHLELSILRARY
jgi:hypothetical protein